MGVDRDSIGPDVELALDHFARVAAVERGVDRIAYAVAGASLVGLVTEAEAQGRAGAAVRSGAVLELVKIVRELWSSHGSFCRS